MNEQEKRNKDIMLGQAINLAHNSTDMMNIEPEQFYQEVVKKYNMINQIRRRFWEDQQKLEEKKKELEIEDLI